MKWKIRKERKQRQLSTETIVPIVADALIAGSVAEGVSIPLLILDTVERPDITELIRVHAHLPPGDVVSSWAEVRGDEDSIFLILDFHRPVEAQAILRFSIAEQGILVDAAVIARAAYLQAGVPGDRFIQDPDRPKLALELPETPFHGKWDAIFLNRMTHVVARRAGLSLKKAEPVAALMIEDLRKVTGFRMPRE